MGHSALRTRPKVELTANDRRVALLAVESPCCPRAALLVVAPPCPACALPCPARAEPPCCPHRPAARRPAARAALLLPALLRAALLASALLLARCPAGSRTASHRPARAALLLPALHCAALLAAILPCPARAPPCWPPPCTAIALLCPGHAPLFPSRALPLPALCASLVLVRRPACVLRCWLRDTLLCLLWLLSVFSPSIMRAVRSTSLTPPATVDSATHSQWLTRDTAAHLAIRNYLPLAERAHFGQHKTAKALYDAVVARYSSPATAALSRLILPYLFPKLSAFSTVEDFITHLRTSNTRYHAALPAEFLDRNPPPMYITLYFIVTRLPDSLRAARDHFLALDQTYLTVDLLEKHLLAAETSVVAVGAARGTPRTPSFEGCSPSPLAPSYASAAAADILAGVVVVEAVEAVEVAEVAVGVVAGVGASVAAVVAVVGVVVAVVAAVGGVAAAVVAVGVELFRGEVLAVARGSSSSVRARRRPAGRRTGRAGRRDSKQAGAWAGQGGAAASRAARGQGKAARRLAGWPARRAGRRGRWQGGAWAGQDGARPAGWRAGRAGLCGRRQGGTLAGQDGARPAGRHDAQGRAGRGKSLVTSSPATIALGRLILPYLFPELSAFATVEDLVTHLRTSDARYRAALPAEFLDRNPPPMYITLYFIVTHLPDSLRTVRDHILALNPTDLTVDMLEQHLLAAETSVVAVGAACGTPCTPFFEGCSPSPLAPSYAFAATVDILDAEDVGAASASSGKRRSSKGKGGRSGGDGSRGGGSGSSGSGGSRGGAVQRGGSGGGQR
ncbi:unnamed protein product [Closterium sp. NIES-54]